MAAILRLVRNGSHIELNTTKIRRYIQSESLPLNDAALITGVGTLVATTRRWVHYTQLLGFGAWIFLFYLSLLRFELVPRALAILGLIGILLQFTGVTLLAFLGYSIVPQLAMPLAPIHIANGLWLMHLQ